MLYPNKAVQLQNANSTGGYAEGLAEVKKALHSLNNTTHGTTLNSTYYMVGDKEDTTVGSGTILTAISAGANSHANAFIIGQESEVFPQKNDVILSGLNTTGSTCFFKCVLQSTGPQASYTLHFFAYIDVILVIENGLISTTY